MRDDIGLFVCVKVFNATFNNISVISWRSDLLVEETGRPGENHRPVASHWHILLNTVVSFEYTSAWARFKLTTLMVIGTDCTGSCKSNYAMRPRRSLRDEKSNNSQYHMISVPARNIIMECLDLIYKFVFRGEEGGRKVGMGALGVHREVGTSLRSAPIFVIYKAGFKPTPYWW
jgi:hypothetical protein